MQGAWCLLMELGFAPAWSKTFTHPTWPCRQVTCRAVPNWFSFFSRFALFSISISKHGICPFKATSWRGGKVTLTFSHLLRLAPMRHNNYYNYHLQQACSFRVSTGYLDFCKIIYINSYSSIMLIYLCKKEKYGWKVEQRKAALNTTLFTTTHCDATHYMVSVFLCICIVLITDDVKIW